MNPALPSITFWEITVGDKVQNKQTGGVNVSGGTVNTGGGAIVGRDMNVGRDVRVEQTALDEAFRGIQTALGSAPPEKRDDAHARLEELKTEAAKGSAADDGVVARLVTGLVDLVPDAVSAVVSAFATPALGAIAGPVTRIVLSHVQNKPR
jgi:hypothetical protein